MSTQQSLPKPASPASIIRPTRRKRSTPSNPLQAGITSYLSAHHPHTAISPSHLPRRYSIYPPLLLLPSNTFTSPSVWSTLYAALSATERQALYASIVHSFSGSGVTHIALDAPICASTPSGAANFVRSPTGLVGLFGDFGPGASGEDGDGDGTPSGTPSGADFEKAFWCNAEQNGVVQVWAPLWTMFSRGNVKEKARISGMSGSFVGVDDGLAEVAVVDLFVGIGYFAFSYLKRGVGTVWGWEVNKWSVEGLRRGAERNGWGVEVVGVREGDGFVREEVLKEVLRGRARVVLFHGDNCWAGLVMGRLEGLARRMGVRWRRVRHVNLGLLPDARGAWEGAVRVLDGEVGGWLHVHENADVDDIQEKREEIVQGIGKLCAKYRRGEWKAGCVHVEQVKTYAPGVMHCVFDVEIKPP